MKLRVITPVDCGDCRACCRYQLIPMLPGEDDPSLYRTREHPLGLVLAQRPDGWCVHSTSEGCDVYPNHPAICRGFDCAENYAKSSRAERRALLRSKDADPAVFTAGRRQLRLRLENGPR